MCFLVLFSHRLSVSFRDASVGRCKAPELVHEDRGQEQGVPWKKRRPAVTNRSARSSAPAHLRYSARHLSQQRRPARPISNTLDPLFRNSLLAGHHPGQRARYSARRICVAPAVENCADCGGEIPEVLVPGVDRHGHRVIHETVTPRSSPSSSANFVTGRFVKVRPPNLASSSYSYRWFVGKGEATDVEDFWCARCRATPALR